MQIQKYLVFSLGLFLMSCGTGPREATLVLKNGTIVTVDPEKPQAQAVAIVENKIYRVGSDTEIEPLIGEQTRVIDLKGKLAIPGFIEGHGHFMRLGETKMMLDLTNAVNWQDVIAKVKRAAQQAPRGAWITGWGWHQEKWDRPPQNAVEGLPVHRDLSRVSPENPVFLTHASGHASFANAAALKAVGIKKGTPDPPGGEIVLDKAGHPTGVLRENAQDILEEAIAAYKARRSADQLQQEQIEQVRLAGQEALKNGVTTFHDAGTNFRTIDFLKERAESGELPIRLYIMIRYETIETLEKKLPAYRFINIGNNFLTVRSIKRQIDGALGSHGAWLLDPYADLPASKGLNLEPIDEIHRTTRLGIEHGFQINTHAIGDKANRVVLDMYQDIFKNNPEHKNLRWRIEHVQHIHPEDIPRLAQLGIIASVQGVHATSDGPWIEKRLGKKRAMEGAYMWRKLWDAGTIITNGTDVPVENINPIMSFYAMVSRRMSNDAVFYGSQKLTREEALKTYTINNAHAAFEEEMKGSITPGKLADIVILSKNIMSIPEDEIPQTEVLYTLLDGKVVYQKQE